LKKSEDCTKALENVTPERNDNERNLIRELLEDLRLEQQETA
jgi:hypothetical protein